MRISTPSARYSRWWVCIGTIPDINGAVFVTPIDVSYAEGLNSNYDRQIESRTASIAYANTKAPLEGSQYHNRQCQLMGSVIRSVVHTQAVVPNKR